MIVLKNFKNIIHIPELMKKLTFTLGVLIVFRLGSYLPVAGINVSLLADMMKRATGLGGILQYFDIFSGGALTKCALFALGIGPYITASIMLQVLSMTIPYLEQLAKEGEYGSKIINQYTRYLTILLSVAYSSGLLTWLEFNNLVLTPGFGFRAFFVLSITTGAVVVMWLGEQISLRGLGNGSSVLIFASIVSGFPGHIASTLRAMQVGQLSLFMALLILVLFIAVAGCIVFLEKGERKIPVQYARRVIGQRVYGGQNSYIPFKINSAGVMPAIFASSVLSIPLFIAGTLSERFEFLRPVAEALKTNGMLYNILTFILIVAFTFVWTALIFNPTDLADKMKKNGGFVPGIRPGKSTADYFDFILTRIGLVGAVYLGILVLLPNIMQAFIRMPFVLGGTSLLIAVGVAMEFSSQMESYLIENKYGSFLTSGRIKNRV